MLTILSVLGGILCVRVLWTVVGILYWMLTVPAHKDDGTEQHGSTAEAFMVFLPEVILYAYVRSLFGR